MFWSILVGAISFGWLYHHTYYYRAKEGESPNIDNLEVGVFPKEYDNFKLTGVGTGDGTVEADVDVAYGTFAIGMKF